jgi:curved DNA-binding protein CbpA
MPGLERNHYRVLGVAADASEEEIERSFRQLARRLHPDVNGGDGAAEERMKELNVARAALADPAARAAYDERLRRELRAKIAMVVPPLSTPGASTPSASPVTAPRPLVPPKTRAPWLGSRHDVRAPTATAEIDRVASVGRLFWIGLVALIGLAAVVALILLREALDP